MEIKQRDLNPWLDEWELRPGSAWKDSLEDIIQACGSVAVEVQFGLHVVLFQPGVNQHAAHGQRTIVMRVNHEGRWRPGVPGEDQPSFRGMRTQPAVCLAECHPA